MFRRLFLVLTIILLDDYPYLRFLSVLSQSLISLGFLIVVRPYESKNTAFFEIYNEVTILLVTYLISVNTDPSIDEYSRFNMGWVITAIIALNIIANFINIIQ